MGTSTLLRLCRIAAVCACAIAANGAAHAATGSAPTRAVALRPLSVVKIRDLDFGNMSSSPVAGTVAIDAQTGARTTTGGVTPLGGTPQSAQFYTYGTGNVILFIQLSAAPTLTRAGGGATMNVSNLTLNGPALRLFPPAGLYDLRVGGTLAVGANQLEGTYSGTFDLTVTYF